MTGALKTLLLVIAIIIWQKCLLPKILKAFRENVNRTVKDKIAEIESKDPSEAKRIREKFGSERFTNYRTKKLGYITTIVGVAEIIFFGALTVLLIRHSELHIIERIETFLKIFGGWLAIKTATNYDQWSDVIAGKAYLYISLFGTFLNVIFAIGMGWLFS